MASTSFLLKGSRKKLYRKAGRLTRASYGLLNCTARRVKKLGRCTKQNCLHNPAVLGSVLKVLSARFPDLRNLSSADIAFFVELLWELWPRTFCLTVDNCPVYQALLVSIVSQYVLQSVQTQKTCVIILLQLHISQIKMWKTK